MEGFIIFIVLMIVAYSLFYAFRPIDKKMVDLFDDEPTYIERCNSERKDLTKWIKDFVKNPDYNSERYFKFDSTAIAYKDRVVFNGVSYKFEVTKEDYNFEVVPTHILREVKKILSEGNKCVFLFDFIKNSEDRCCTDGLNWYNVNVDYHVGVNFNVGSSSYWIGECINCETLEKIEKPKLFFPIGVLKECENPRKQYWERFLEKEMLDKKKLDQEMKDWVDSVILKHQKYNDLQYKYECLPSSPIDDIDGFKNFCKIIHEGCKYEDYMVSNYLMLKVSEKRFNNMLETTRKQFP